MRRSKAHWREIMICTTVITWHGKMVIALLLDKPHHPQTGSVVQIWPTFWSLWGHNPLDEKVFFVVFSQYWYESRDAPRSFELLWYHYDLAFDCKETSQFQICSPESVQKLGSISARIFINQNVRACDLRKLILLGKEVSKCTWGSL